MLRPRSTMAQWQAMTEGVLLGALLAYNHHPFPAISETSALAYPVSQ